MKTIPKIVIISEDYIFSNIIQGLINIHIDPAIVIIYESFSAAKSISNYDSIDVIIIDDKITGTASHEIEAYIREEKRISCNIYYFSNDEYEEEQKALERGANYFFKKPFKPQDFIEHITHLLATTVSRERHDNSDDGNYVKIPHSRYKVLKTKKKSFLLTLTVILFALIIIKIIFTIIGNIQIQKTNITIHSINYKTEVEKTGEIQPLSKEIDSIPPIIKSNITYYIIAGGFKNKIRANKFKSQLVNYSPQLIVYKDFFLISIYSDSSKKEVKMNLKQLQKQLRNNKLWIYKETK
jgi:DNA-binding response OmpR family regulator